jgi:phage head maturation protease
MERKSFSFAVKSESTPGQFRGRASVYGNTDAVNDVVMPGAFSKSLQELGGEIVVLNQHNPSDPIGKARLFDRSDALHAEGQLVLDLPQRTRRLYATQDRADQRDLHRLRSRGRSLRRQRAPAEGDQACGRSRW